MIEIKKIKDKEEIEVLSQRNCTVAGKPNIYLGPNSDCLSNCTVYGKPKYYMSIHY
ncbi:Uncharacterised protein [[Clostridium] sordellii]|uniref:hypothetical protein n=1 Tax=Paraclostridium sordellii TaxID=1505 RepID=UPI0005DD6CDE|nr:hypothetical protein [Paeniclostridium sordellii]CEN23296.1 Uncharacterised protein [[Clostridium] sordellii] [Paeniclostridium sordellii]CEN23651.1 Uncharacterised protein [[Clostridium] sordellii] [Paeniclostridium sordellii]